MPSTGPFGATERDLFGAEIPIRGLLGDQQAALFGHACFSKGDMKVTYGTGAFLWVNAGDVYSPKRDPGFLQTVAWHLDKPTYALEGFIMYAGAIIDWLANGLNLGATASDIEQKARDVGESLGVFLVPAFQGLGSPWWDSDTRAAFFGISGGTKGEHLCHAALESICFQVRRVLETIVHSMGPTIQEVCVDGGLSQSEYLMQMQANILDLPVRIAANQNVTPLGIALMAGLGCGYWDSIGTIRSLITAGQLLEPISDKVAYWDQPYGRWLEAVKETIIWTSNSLQTSSKLKGTDRDE